MPIIKCLKCGEENIIPLGLGRNNVWICKNCNTPLDTSKISSQSVRIIKEELTDIESQERRGLAEEEEIFQNEENENQEEDLRCLICGRAFTSLKPSHLYCYRCWFGMKTLIEEFIQALEEEISNFQSKESKIPIINGKLIREEGKFIYSFHSENEDKIYVGLDDAPIDIKLGDSRYRGEVIGVKDSEIIIYVSHNLGKSVPRAELIINRCFLYEKLKEKFEVILENKNAITAKDFWLANSIFIEKGKNLPTEIANSQYLPFDFPEKFKPNDSQIKAIEVSQQLPLTLIWGPPGTGKTKTLAGVVTEFLKQGKKVLVTAHSNIAVDEATIKIADLLKETKHYKNGEIIRIGNYQKEKLKIEYPLVLLDEIIKNKSGQLYIKMITLAKEKKNIEEILSQLVKLSELFIQKKKIEDDVQGSEEQKQEIALQILSSQEKLKLDSKNIKFPIKYTSEPAISKMIERLNKEKGEISSQLEEINRKLETIRKSILSNIRIMCTTLTKTFSNRWISEQFFDVLIVDEASMAPIPYLYWALRQCKDSVVIVGDFLQLQPICSSGDRKKMANKWLKNNIYNYLELDTASKAIKEEKVCLLEIQYRMNPKISKISNEIFYHNFLKDAEETKTFNLDFGEFNDPLILIDTSLSSLSRCEKVPGSSRINKFHAEVVINLLKKILIFEGFKNRKIGIITPYNPQVKFIKERIKEEKLKLENLSVATVHRFQGGEAEIMIFDTVEAPGLKTYRSMLEDDRKELLNVAITRAKCKIFLVANLDFIKKELSHCTFLTRIIDILKHDGEVKEV